jgi:hypothetical protein
MIYHDITIQLDGRQRSQRQHESTALVRGAVEVFRYMLETGTANFRRPMAHKDFTRIQLQWTQETWSAAVATFWVGQIPLTTSALASGRDAAADQEVLRAAQGLVLKFFGDSPVEPAFDLLRIEERPVIASVVLPVPLSLHEDLGLVADMETCLAAAFFESLQEDDHA